MTSPLNGKDASIGHSSGQNPPAHVEKLAVISPISSLEPITVSKRRNGTHVQDSFEVTESKSTVSEETRNELVSRSERRSTNVTDGSIVRFTSDRQVLFLRETVSSTKSRFIGDLEHVNEHLIDSMTIDNFLDYIESERLTHMPHHGSRWDKVLKWAEFYTVQIAGFQKAVFPFIQDSKGAAQLIWVACRSLLEVSLLKCLSSHRRRMFPLEFQLNFYSSDLRMPKHLKLPSESSTKSVYHFPSSFDMPNCSHAVRTFVWRWARLSTTCFCW